MTRGGQFLEKIMSIGNTTLGCRSVRSLLAAAGLAAAALALRPPRPARFEAPPAAA